MSLRFVSIIISLFCLSSCADGVKTYFKKSANNKLVDTAGFDGGKRKPLYNKKYIELAKKNVVEKNFAEEDAEEDSDEFAFENYQRDLPEKRNRSFYMRMIKSDSGKNKKKTYGSSGAKSDTYPSLKEADKKISGNDIDTAKLRKELEEIKSSLDQTRAELSKYKCPSPKIDEKSLRGEDTEYSGSEEIADKPSFSGGKDINPETDDDDSYRALSDEGEKAEDQNLI